MGRLLRARKCCYFHRGTKNNLEWEIYLYDTDSLVASLIKTLTFQFALYLSHNEWSRSLEKMRGNIKCFYAILALTQFIGVLFILSLIFHLHYVLVLCFLLAFYKNWVSIQGPKSQKVWDESMVWNSFT